MTPVCEVDEALIHRVNLLINGANVHRVKSALGIYQVNAHLYQTTQSPAAMERYERARQRLQIFANTGEMPE